MALASRRSRIRGSSLTAASRRVQMRVATRLEILVDIRHQVRSGAAEHDLHVRRLEADVLEAVNHLGGTGHAIPGAERGFHPFPRGVLEEDEHLAFEDEED